MGFNRNTPLNIVYGPRCYGGIDFRDLYQEQGLSKLETFVKHWRTNTQSSIHLRIAVSWAQYTAGTSTPIFTNTQMRLPHLESIWLKDLRNFMNKNLIQLELDDNCITPLQRIGDAHIMDSLLTSNIPNTDIKRINYVRLFLDVHTVSDISNATGTHLDEDLLHGRLEKSSSIARGHGANQERPAAIRTWQIWRAACRTFCLPNSWKLKQTLGSWTLPHQSLRRTWKYHYSPGNDCIYTGEKNMHREHPRNHLPYRFERFAQLQDIDFRLPDDMYPVDASVEHNTIRAVVCGGHCFPAMHPEPEDFHEYVERLPPSEKNVIAKCEFHIVSRRNSETTNRRIGICVQRRNSFTSS